jgi:hypothetical protein
MSLKGRGGEEIVHVWQTNCLDEFGIPPYFAITASCCPGEQEMEEEQAFPLTTP